MKGIYFFAINQFADFIRECGLTQFLEKWNHERAIHALMEKSDQANLAHLINGSWKKAMYLLLSGLNAATKSAASHGRAERAH